MFTLGLLAYRIYYDENAESTCAMASGAQLLPSRDCSEQCLLFPLLDLCEFVHWDAGYGSRNIV